MTPSSSDSRCCCGCRHRRRDRHFGYRISVDVHGDYRHRIGAIRSIREQARVLEDLVGLIQNVSDDLLPYEEPERLRAAANTMRAAVLSVVDTSTNIAARIGEVQFMAALDAISRDEVDPDFSYDDSDAPDGPPESAPPESAPPDSAPPDSAPHAEPPPET